MDDVARAIGELTGEIRGMKVLLERNDRDCRDSISDHSERLGALEQQHASMTGKAIGGATVGGAIVTGVVWVWEHLTK